MNERRGPWYLLTGLVIGLVVGLLYTWVLNPVEFVDTNPLSLRPEFKDQYRVMIARAYEADQNLVRAYERLKLLGDQSSVETLSAQAQRLLTDGGAVEDAQALALLASALEKQPQPSAGTPGLAETAAPATLGTAPPTADASLAVQTVTPVWPTQTPQATFTPRPTSAAVAPDTPFLLRDRQQVCDPQAPHALLQVELEDSNGQPLAGVKLTILWEGGEDSFFTGLYPQISAGYADFTLTPGVVYSLRAGEGGETVSDLSVPECTAEDGTPYLGGWSLRFESSQS